MGKPRRRHVQQELFTHGGKRKGAGRKPKGTRAGASHTKRPELKPRFPVHVVLRVHEDLRDLRRRRMYSAIREATIAVAKSEVHWREVGAFRIVHASIQNGHIHLLVEADNKDALANGLQRFQISAAKHLNREISIERKLPVRRRGSVFPDRYYSEIITTPRQARHALAYVLNNWRKHREDRSRETRNWKVDPFSTGVLFTGWREREGEPFMMRYRETYKPLVVYLPKTWLLQIGWRRGGGTIPYDYVPSSPFVAARTASPQQMGSTKRQKRTQSAQMAMW